MGDFDFDALRFPENGIGDVFHLPRDNHCNIVYCNVEGARMLLQLCFRSCLGQSGVSELA